MQPHTGELSAFEYVLANPKKIENLIQALGSDEFDTREAAAKDLGVMGGVALPALEAARKSSDPEIRAQAAIVLKQMEDNQRILPVMGLGQIAHALALSPDAKFWAVASGTGKNGGVTSGILDLKTNKLFGMPVRIENSAGPRVLLFTPDSKRMITGNANGTISIYTLKP